MGTELLQEIKTLYEERQKIKSKCIKYKKILEEYQNEITPTDNQILDSILLNYSNKIKETNQIFICLGSFVKILDENKVDYIMIDRDDPKTEFRIYVDLEKDISSSINIPIKNCAKFEENHKVIIPQTFFTEEYFYKLRRQFVKDAISTTQEQALQKILKNENIKN